MINMTKLEKLMRELGHPEIILGTGYLRKGIELYEDGQRRMTGEIYPNIARAANTTASRVERAMRHSIQRAWERGNVEVQSKIFGYTVDPDKGTPTVGEYIAQMARECHED